MNKLEKLHAEVTMLENHYENCRDKAMEKGNMQAMMIHSAEASAYTRVRWMIEGMMEGEDE